MARLDRRALHRHVQNSGISGLAADIAEWALMTRFGHQER